MLLLCNLSLKYKREPFESLRSWKCTPEGLFSWQPPYFLCLTPTPPRASGEKAIVVNPCQERILQGKFIRAGCGSAFCSTYMVGVVSMASRVAPRDVGPLPFSCLHLKNWCLFICVLLNMHPTEGPGRHPDPWSGTVACLPLYPSIYHRFSHIVSALKCLLNK